MTSVEWWASLLQGSLGAVIGLVGLFGVFWFIRRHELSRDATARQEHDKLVARQRTEAGIVKIVEAAHVLRFGSEVTKDDEFQNLCHAFTVFGAEEAADHPKAAKWATLQSSKVLQVRGHNVDVRAAPWQAAYITSILSKWALRFPECFFPKTNDASNESRETRTDEVDSLIADFDRAGRAATYDNIREMIEVKNRYRHRDSEAEVPLDPYRSKENGPEAARACRNGTRAT